MVWFRKAISQKRLRQGRRNTGDKSRFSLLLSSLAVDPVRMDSEVMREGRLLDIVDDQWRMDKLPNDDIEIPPTQLPNDADGGKEDGEKNAEERWADLALHNLNASQTSNQGMWFWDSSCQTSFDISHQDLSVHYRDSTCKTRPCKYLRKPLARGLYKSK